MRVLLSTVGTRNDVRPVLALHTALEPATGVLAGRLVSDGAEVTARHLAAHA